ncbi:MAG: hypothetical protein AAGF07_03870 [Patescibacteria group bacterium]
MIVKTLDLRKNLKQLLHSTSEEELFLDYYGELYKIVPVKKAAQPKPKLRK